MRKQTLTALLQSLSDKLQNGLAALRKAEMGKKVLQISPKVKEALQVPRTRIKPGMAAFHKIVASMRLSQKKVFCAVALVTALFAAVIGVHASAGSPTYLVYLDEEKIGHVSSGTEILEYVAELENEERDRYGLDVRAIQEVRVEREQRKGVKAGDWEVRDVLRRRLAYDVYAYVITVNGRPTLAVRTLDDYRRVIEDLKGAYVSGKDNAVIQAVVLNDKVEARLTLVDPDALYTADKAAEILRRGTDRREVYLVSRGDSLWTIARSNNMSVTEIRKANPQLGESDRLQVGEELNLVVSEPLVNVSVTQEVALTQRIPFGTRYQDDKNMYRGTSRILQPGRSGIKEVTYRITQTNGSEVLREVVDEIVVEEPTEQVVARGTKAVALPAGVRVGTGRFLWPVAGGGRITSRFGYRGRGFHRGVDIGNPPGSPVLAADSGVVTQSGWSGAYGILVAIDHGNGYVTKYAHNSATLVSVGQRVQKGQQIARLGSTGNSTGPHLHFEVIRRGQHVNPLKYF